MESLLERIIAKLKEEVAESKIDGTGDDLDDLHYCQYVLDDCFAEAVHEATCDATPGDASPGDLPDGGLIVIRNGNSISIFGQSDEDDGPEGIGHFGVAFFGQPDSSDWDAPCPPPPPAAMFPSTAATPWDTSQSTPLADIKSVMGLHAPHQTDEWPDEVDDGRNA